MVIAFAEKNGSFSQPKLYKLALPSPNNGRLHNNRNNNLVGSTSPAAAVLQEENPQPEPSWVESLVSPWLWPRQLLTLLQLSFLPLGYPDSVSEDYLAYQLWDTMQDVTFGLCFALANSSILKASVDLGNQEAGVVVGAEIAFGVAFIMLLKQTCTKIGPVCLGWAKCQTFDSQCKKWRFFADVSNDVIMFVEICTPLLPSNMVVGTCCAAAVLRGIVTVVGSSSRASLIMHHARSNNAADVSTKENCQLNCANLVCLLVASTLLPSVLHSQTTIFAIFFVLTFIHQFANIKGQSVLLMTSLNEERLLICLQQFLRDGTIPSVRATNQCESIFFGCGLSDSQVCGSKIIIGSSLREALGSSNRAPPSADYFEKFLEKSYLIIPTCEPTVASKKFHIVLAENIYEKPDQLLEAYLRSLFSALEAKNLGPDSKFAAAVHHPMDSEITERVQGFTSALRAAGYEVEKISFGVGSWRCTISKTDVAE